MEEPQTFTAERLPSPRGYAVVPYEGKFYVGPTTYDGKEYDSPYAVLNMGRDRKELLGSFEDFDQAEDAMYRLTNRERSKLGLTPVDRPRTENQKIEHNVSKKYVDLMQESRSFWVDKPSDVSREDWIDIQNAKGAGLDPLDIPLRPEEVETKRSRETESRLEANNYINFKAEIDRDRESVGMKPMPEETVQKKYERTQRVEEMREYNEVREGLGFDPVSYEEMETAIGFWEGMTDVGWGVVPFVGGWVDTYEIYNVLAAAKEINQGTASEEDVKLLNEWWLDTQLDAVRGKTWGATVGEIIGQLPAFGGEIAATGFVYSAGRKVGRAAAVKTLNQAVERIGGKAARETVKKHATGRIGRGIVSIAGGVRGAAWQAAIAGTVSGRATASALNNITPDVNLSVDELGKLALVVEGTDMSAGGAAFRGLSDQLIEYGSERLGWMTGKAGLGRMLSRIPMTEHVSAWKAVMTKRWLQGGAGRTAKGFEDLLKKGGWNGVLGEMFEERVGELARVPVDAMTLEEWEYALPDFEQLSAEFVAFLVPGAFNSALSYGAEIGDYKGAKSQGEKVLKNRADQIKGLVKAQLEEESAEAGAESDFEAVTGEAEAALEQAREALGTEAEAEAVTEAEEVDVPEVEPGGQTRMFAPPVAEEAVAEEAAAEEAAAEEAVATQELYEPGEPAVQEQLDATASEMDLADERGVNHQIRPVPADRQTPQTKALTQTMAASGVTVVPVDITTQQGVAPSRGGFVLPSDPRTVYVQETPAGATQEQAQEIMDSNVQAVVMHELTHGIERENQPLFEALVSLMPAGIQRGINDYRSRESDQGGTEISQAEKDKNYVKLVSEGLAMVFQAESESGNIIMTDPANRSILQQVRAWVRRMAVRLGLPGRQGQMVQTVVDQILEGKDISQITLPKQEKILERARRRGLVPQDIGVTQEDIAAEPDLSVQFAPAARVPRSSVEIRRNPEKYRKAIEEFAAKRTVGGKPAGKRITVRVVGEYIQQLVRSEQGAVDLEVITSKRARGENKTKYPKDEAARAEQIEAMSDALVDEVLYQNTVDQEGLEWYTQNIVDTLEVMSFAFPEVATDPLAKQTLVAFMAITSSENSVEENLNNSIMAYQAYRTDGSIEADLAWRGKSIDSVRKNMVKFARFMSSYSTPQEAFDWMNRTHPVAEVNALISGKGKTGRLASERVYGSLVFGPKIGAFLQNLQGNLDVVTQDRWFSRTVFRHAGSLVPETTQEHVDRFREAMAEFRRQGKDTPGMEEGDVSKLTEDQIVLSAIVRARDYSNRGYKKQPEGSIEREMDLAANAIYKSLTEISQAPGAGGKRNLWDAVVNRASEKLKDQGQDLDPATIQAIIWYYEKQLYAELGAPPKVRDNDFLANALRVIPEVMEKRDGTGSWERATEGTRWSGDRSAEQRQPRPAPSTVRDRRAAGRVGESVEGVRDQAPAFAPKPETPEERAERLARQKEQNERDEAAIRAGGLPSTRGRQRAAARITARRVEEGRKEGRAAGLERGKVLQERAEARRDARDETARERRERQELKRRLQQQRAGAEAGYRAGKAETMKAARAKIAEVRARLKKKMLGVKEAQKMLADEVRKIITPEMAKEAGYRDINTLVNEVRGATPKTLMAKIKKVELKAAELSWKEARGKAKDAIGKKVSQRIAKIPETVPTKQDVQTKEENDERGLRQRAKDALEKLRSVIEGNKTTNLREKGSKPLTADEYEAREFALREATNNFKAAMSEGSQERKAIVGQRTMTQGQVSEEIAEEVESASTSEIETEKKRTPFLKRMFYLQLDPTSLIQRITRKFDNSSVLYSLMVTALRRAENSYNKRLQEVIELANEAAINAGYSSLSDALVKTSGTQGEHLVEKIDLVLGGKTYRGRPLGEALHLVLLDPETRRKVIEGNPLSFHSDPVSRIENVTAEELDAIRDQLSPELVAFGEAMKDILEAEIRPSMFDAIRRIRGFEPETVFGYWPISRRMSESKQQDPNAFLDGNEGIGSQMNRYIDNSTQTKERTKDTTNPIRVIPAATTFVEHVDTGLRISEMAETLRLADSVLRSDAVRDAIVRKHGMEVYKDFRRQILEASGTQAQYITPDKILGAVTSNVAQSLLVTNVRTWVLQLTGIPRLLGTAFNPAELAAGVVWAGKNFGGAKEQIADASGYAWRRWSKSAADRYGPQRYSQLVPLDGNQFGSNTVNAVKNLMNMKFSDAYKSWTTATEAIKILDAFDGVSFSIAFGAAKYRLRDQGLTEQELNEAAGELASDAIRNTQNSTSALDLSMGTRSMKESAYFRLMYMFSSDPLKLANIFTQSVQMMKNGERAKGGQMFIGALTSVAAAVAWRTAWVAGFGAAMAAVGGNDDDRKAAERAAKTEQAMYISIVRELAGLTFFGPIIETIGGTVVPDYPGGDIIDNPVSSVINASISTGKKAYESFFKLEDFEQDQAAEVAGLASAKALNELLGVFAGNPFRAIANDALKLADAGLVYDHVADLSALEKYYDELGLANLTDEQKKYYFKARGAMVIIKELKTQISSFMKTRDALLENNPDSPEIKRIEEAIIKLREETSEIASEALGTIEPSGG